MKMLRAAFIARQMIQPTIRLKSLWWKISNSTTIRPIYIAGRPFANTSCVLCDNSRETGIFKSPLPDIQIPDDMNVAEYIMKDFDKFGNREALVDGITGKSYTFTQLKELVYKCASGLTLNGFNKGDTCAIYLPNIPEYFVIFSAVSVVGGITTTINPLYTTEELVQQLMIPKPSIIITLPMFAETARQAAERIASIKDIYVIGQADGCKTYSSLLDNNGSAFPRNLTIHPKKDVAVIPYSSGTTGLPKGVMITHFNYISNLEQLRTHGLLNRSEDDTTVAVMPFFHLYGMLVIFIISLSQGSRVISLPRFDQEVFLKTIQDYKVNYVPIVPPIVLFLAKHPLVDKYDLSCIEQFLCAAAPLSDKLPTAMLSRINPNAIFRQAYGLTETAITHVCYGNDPSQWPTGSSGTLVPNAEAKVVDVNTGETLPVGETGNLCLRGPSVMKGYFGNPEETANTIDNDGWLSSGDLCHIDEKGHVHIEDRLKELIKYKGFQVAPAELEALLISHPEIQDVAVVPVQDGEAGELPKAFIVTNSKNLLPEDVYKFVEGKVAPFKKLRGGVEVIDEIPKSPSGKILRRLLRDRQKQNGR
ncbi:uncharacterized protein LOC144435842 [Glandiceps talaboti]